MNNKCETCTCAKCNNDSCLYYDCEFRKGVFTNDCEMDVQWECDMCK